MSSRTAIAIVIVGVAISKSIDFSPFANGAIPASKRLPHEHWSYMAKGSCKMLFDCYPLTTNVITCYAIIADVSFVRKMTERLTDKWRKTKATEETKGILRELKVESYIGCVDFGGADDHVAQKGDPFDLENLRVVSDHFFS